MKSIGDAVDKIAAKAKVRLDDIVDRLCYRFTPSMLLLFVLITASVDFFKRPLTCMVPAEYSESWVNFVHQYCYVTGTYLKEHVMTSDKPEKIYVHYYQWVPFVIIGQAIALRLPLFFWKFGQKMPDIDFNFVNELCCDARTSEGAKREEKLTEATNYIYQLSQIRGGGLGSMASFMYLLYKVMNIVLVAAQIFFLNCFVGYNDHGWGITLARESWNNLGWQEQFSYFPRLAYCDHGRDFLGNSDGAVVTSTRCVLSINMLNEKIFLVLYFWYHSLIVLTVVNLLIYLIQLWNPFRMSSVKSFLGLVTPKTEVRVIRRLANDVLGQDGALLLRFVRQNAGPLIADEVGSRLYNKLMGLAAS